MSEDPLRLTEMSDPPHELIALVRRMEGPPPLPPELPGPVAPRPRLRIVGPALALVTVAVGAYIAYRLVDAPPRPARSEPVAVMVEAPPPTPPPPPEPVVATAIIDPPLVDAPPPPTAPARSRPRPTRPEPAPVAADSIDPLATDVTEADERAYGRVILQTIPWAHVVVDDRDTGRTTPTQLRVPAGRHTIGLRTEDGAMHTVVVTVEAGETTRIVRQLSPPEPRPRSRPIPLQDLVRPF